MASVGQSIKKTWAGPAVQEFLGELRKSWAKPPNFITYARIAGAVLPNLFFLSGYLWSWHVGFLNTPLWWLWAAPVTYGLVAATDGVDGYVARKWGWVSELGAMLDPIADKLLVILTLVMVCVFKLWVYPAMIIILLREIEITRVRFRAKRATGVTVAANRGGKNKAIVQYIAVAAVLMPIHGIVWTVVTAVLLTIAVVLSIHSLIKYEQQVDELIRSV